MEDIKGFKLYFIMALTFIIVFLMNYIGNPEPDKLQRAALTGISASVFFAIGIWAFRKFGKDKDDHQEFD